MNKDEILKTITNEENYDEMEQSILFKALSISTLIMQIICIIFIIFQIYYGLAYGTRTNIAPLVSLIFVQFSVVELYQFTLLKRKKHIFLFIIYTLITLVAFYLSFYKNWE